MTKKVMQVDDLQIIVEKKKNVKNLYLRVLKPYGEIKVTSPYRVSDKVIKEFVMSKIREIREIVEKIKKQNAIEFKSGEIHYLWGTPYKLIAEKAYKNSIKLGKDTILLQTQELENFEKNQKLFNEFYREELKKVLPKVMEEKCKLMNLSVNEYRIKNMKTRWGTCNITDRRIWINLQITKKSLDCLEYVVVHELAHLIEKNHNKKFYEIVGKFYPNWKNVELELDKF